MGDARARLREVHVFNESAVVQGKQARLGVEQTHCMPGQCIGCEVQMDKTHRLLDHPGRFVLGRQHAHTARRAEQVRQVLPVRGVAALQIHRQCVVTRLDVVCLVVFVAPDSGGHAIAQIDDTLQRCARPTRERTEDAGVCGHARVRRSGVEGRAHASMLPTIAPPVSGGFGR